MLKCICFINRQIFSYELSGPTVFSSTLLSPSNSGSRRSLITYLPCFQCYQKQLHSSNAGELHKAKNRFGATSHHM